MLVTVQPVIISFLTLSEFICQFKQIKMINGDRATLKSHSGVGEEDGLDNSDIPAKLLQKDKKRLHRKSWDSSLRSE